MRRHILNRGGPHRLRDSLITAGIAVGALAIAFAGGAISGKFEHRSTAQVLATLPPTTTTSSTSTTTTVAPADAATVAAVQANVVEDMSLDVQSQRLEPDPRRRAALAASAAAVAARHGDITLAWVPEKVAALQATYDKRVHDNALNPAAPSVTESQFLVTSWTKVNVDGIHATVVLIGHYRLTEPTNHSVPGGIVDQHDQVWMIVTRLSGGRWRLEDRGTT